MAHAPERSLSSASTMLPTTVRIALEREPSADPFLGSRYRAVRELAVSPAAALYVVEHIELGKQFAAKVIRRELLEDENALDRLRLEAQALGRLRHPNIVVVHGFDHTNDGTPFLVMELLKGRTLAEELALRGPLATAFALELVCCIASALGAIHALGVVHRDVTPQNVFLHRHATGQMKPKLLDFGSVRVLAGSPPRAPLPLAIPTTSGTVVGTPGFLSPEQLQGRTADQRSDIFQLGLLLYCALTGRVPASGMFLADDTRPTFDLDTPDGGSVGTNVRAPKFLTLFRKALAEDPEQRFQTMADFAAHLELVRSTATLGSNTETPTRTVDGCIETATATFGNTKTPTRTGGSNTETPTGTVDSCAEAATATFGNTNETALPRGLTPTRRIEPRRNHRDPSASPSSRWSVATLRVWLFLGLTALGTALVMALGAALGYLQ